MKRWIVKVKDFEVLPEYSPFDSDQVSDWLNEKGLNPKEVAMVWQGDILKVYYREWNPLEDTG